MKKFIVVLALAVSLGLPSLWGQSSVTGNITAAGSTCGTTNCVRLNFPVSPDLIPAAATVQVTGTFSATLEFEQSTDDGTTWVAANGAGASTGTVTQTTTATGVWVFQVAARTNLRVRGSAYTSGTAAVKIRSSPASSASTNGGGAFTGISDINGAAGPSITLVPGTTGTDVNIDTDVNTIIVNVPDASCVSRGVITVGAQTLCGPKSFTDPVTFNEDVTFTGGAVQVIEGTDCSLVNPVVGAAITCFDANTLLYYISINGGTFQVLNTNPATVQNGLISGCSVAYTGSGLVFTIQACVYSIGGQQFVSPQGNITLNAADGSNPRIDVIAVDNTGTVVKITGTAAGSPSEPTTDPTTQLKLTSAYVATSATTPSNVATASIYLENTEWTTARSPATDPPWNLASTSNPYAGTKDIEATTAATTNYVTLTNGSPVTLTGYNVLIFYIRSKATWNNKRSLVFQFLNSTTPVTQGIVLKDGAFGFNSSVTTSYQQIAIPISLFAPTTTADVLKITVTGTGTSTIGFYLDNIILQGGVPQPTLPTGIMLWKGTYSATATYQPNDVVTSSGTTYLALTTNTAVTPVAGTNWQALGGGTAFTFVDNEVPSGSINSSNQTFTLAHTPSPSTSLICAGNGVRWQSTGDFTLSSATITTVGTLQTGDVGLICSYRY